MEPKKISVIVPTYRDWHRLSLCFNALDVQSYFKDNVEIIVVNNDPKDLVPNNYFIPENCKIIYEEKPGSYAARNAGIAIAKGEIIAFTDSDCIPDKDWIINGVACLLREENVGVVAGKIQLFYKTSVPNAVEIYEKYTAFRQNDNARSGSCVGANWFSFKSVIDSFGGFDSKLKSNGDTVLSGKISKGGYKIIYADNAVVRHPSRSSYIDIGNKYRRLFGGKYDRTKEGKLLFSIKYIARFIFFRLRFNFKKFFQVSPVDALKILKVNIYLFYSLVSEANLLISGGKSKRT